MGWNMLSNDTQNLCMTPPSHIIAINISHETVTEGHNLILLRKKWKFLSSDRSYLSSYSPIQLRERHRGRVWAWELTCCLFFNSLYTLAVTKKSFTFSLKLLSVFFFTWPISEISYYHMTSDVYLVKEPDMCDLAD